MKNREHRHHCTRPKTHNEAKQSFDEESKGLVRPARNVHHLANAWDDKNRRDETSWKDKRKSKYHVIDVEDLKIEFTVITATWESSYYEIQKKLEAMGFFVILKFHGKHPFKKVTLTYRGTKIRIPKNAEYVT